MAGWDGYVNWRSDMPGSFGPRVCPTCGKCPTCGSGGGGEYIGLHAFLPYIAPTDTGSAAQSLPKSAEVTCDHEAVTA